MNKQDVMKMQTHVLRVNIQCHCDGCKKKIKKLLQKTDGVYSTQVNAEQGKVTVTGNVDPSKLIKKLEKSGKHAVLWGPQKGFNLNQFKNMQIETEKGGHGKDNKSQKGGGKVQPQQQMMPPQLKGSMKDLAKLPNNKDQKSVKFNTQKEEFSDGDEFDDEFDEDDEFDDDFDDEEDDFGHGHHGHGNGNHQMMPNKMMPMMGNGFHVPQGMMTGPGFPDKRGGGGGKKGIGGGDFEMPMVIKGKGDNKGGKNGKKNDWKNGNGKNKDGKDKNGSKKTGGGFLSFMRSSSKKESGNSKEKSTSNNKGNGGGTNHNNNGPKKANNGGDGEGKKGGGQNKMKQFDDFDFKKMGPTGNNPMGQFGGMGGRNEMSGAAQGPPTTGGSAGVGGYYQHPGMGMNQQQQQYMSMMMNQQRQNGNEMYQQMMYGRPQYPVNYMPYYPPQHPTENYNHYFSDENTDSCSIM